MFVLCLEINIWFLQSFSDCLRSIWCKYIRSVVFTQLACLINPSGIFFGLSWLNSSINIVNFPEVFLEQQHFKTPEWWLQFLLEFFLLVWPFYFSIFFKLFFLLAVILLKSMFTWQRKTNLVILKSKLFDFLIMLSHKINLKKSLKRYFFKGISI